VPTFSDFNGLVCPTALKAPTARKRQFPELSNRGVVATAATTGFRHQGEKKARLGAGLKL
jgi:hypothetical protein